MDEWILLLEGMVAIQLTLFTPEVSKERKKERRCLRPPHLPLIL